MNNILYIILFRLSSQQNCYKVGVIFATVHSIARAAFLVGTKNYRALLTLLPKCHYVS